MMQAGWVPEDPEWVPQGQLTCPWLGAGWKANSSQEEVRAEFIEDTERVRIQSKDSDPGRFNCKPGALATTPHFR